MVVTQTLSSEGCDDDLRHTKHKSHQILKTPSLLALSWHMFYEAERNKQNKTDRLGSSACSVIIESTLSIVSLAWGCSSNVIRVPCHQFHRSFINLGAVVTDELPAHLSSTDVCPVVFHFNPAHEL